MGSQIPLLTPSLTATHIASCLHFSILIPVHACWTERPAPSWQLWTLTATQSDEAVFSGYSSLHLWPWGQWARSKAPRTLGRRAFPSPRDTVQGPQPTSLCPTPHTHTGAMTKSPPFAIIHPRTDSLFSELLWRAPARLGGADGKTQMKNTPGNFPGDTMDENLSANAGDMGSVPGPGRSHVSQSN